MKIIDGKVVVDEPTGEPETLTESTESGPALSPDGYPICAACGEPNYEWQPGTRGRKPKYHADHKPVNPNRSASGGTSPRRNSTMRNEQALRDALADRYLGIGRILSIRNPAYGNGIRQNVERAVEADIMYAKQNPKFRRWLEASIEKTALAELIAVHGMMLAPVVIGEKVRSDMRKSSKPRPQQATAPVPPQPAQEPRPATATPTANVYFPDFPAEQQGPPDTTDYDMGIPSV